MNNIKIDDMLFSGRKKRMLTFFGRTLLYCVLVTIISVFCMYMHLYKSNYTTFYTNSDYDYFIQEINREQSDEIRAMDCVEGVFPFSIMTFELNSRVNSPASSGQQIAFLAVESFDDLEYSSFSPDNFIKYDDAVLSDGSRNPIIIDHSLAKDEGITVGDKFRLYSENALKGETREFTVGAITQNHCEFAAYDAMILVNDNVNSDFQLLDPMICYSMAYVKASDITAFQSYLAKEFYPKLSFYSLGDFRELDAEMQSSYYITREALTEMAENDLDFSVTGMAVIIAAAFIALVLVIKREHEKTLDNCMYNIAVGYALGLKKRSLTASLFLRSFIPVTIAVAIASLLCKFVIFDIISSGIYVMAEDAIAFAGISLAAFFVTIFALTCILMRKHITTEKVLGCISNEK